MTIDHQHRRAPRGCPVCGERLRVTQLGCQSCGTGITGDFESCDFCALDAPDLEVLRVFLSSRGNLKELARHLGVSYPTARLRYDEMVRRLGLSVGAEPDPEPEPVAAAPDPRLVALQALASGDLDLDQARRLIGGP
jgi:hypothetical protein